MSTTTGLTKLQQEILKICSVDIDEEELKTIKKILVKYFAKRTMDEADKIWDERGFSNDLMDKWLNDPDQ